MSGRTKCKFPTVHELVAESTGKEKLYLAGAILRDALDELPQEAEPIGEALDLLARITYRMEVADEAARLPLEYQSDIT